MKVSQLMNLKFKSTLQELMTQKLAIKSALKLKRVIDKVDAALNAHESARLEALSKFGSKDENNVLLQEENGNIKLSDENRMAFAKHMQELMNTEVELEKVCADELNDVRLSVEDLVVLEGLIED